MQALRFYANKTFTENFYKLFFFPGEVQNYTFPGALASLYYNLKGDHTFYYVYNI